MAKKTPTSEPLQTLKTVYDFMSENALDAVELVENGAHIKLVRRKAQTVHVPVPIASSYTQAPAPSTSQAAPAANAAPQAAPLPAGTPLKSPMMGIFYRAPSASSPPFVKEGDAVKPGQVLYMIEAMKVFNEIKADYACTIVKIIAENGKPVKSGQDLAIVQR